MKRATLVLIINLLFGICVLPCFSEFGIKPENIYTREMPPWRLIVDTWEILPNVDPLAEKPYLRNNTTQRTRMTLRKDGKCRVFNGDFPQGSDGRWFYQNRKITISLSNAPAIEYFVYGVKGDYMWTHTSRGGGSDQLWTRAK
jgi:hypothetical protein